MPKILPRPSLSLPTKKPHSLTKANIKTKPVQSSGEITLAM